MELRSALSQQMKTEKVGQSNCQSIIGPDVPVAINNLTLKWGEEQNIASLSWEAPDLKA
jgi:hypothetical protein